MHGTCSERPPPCYSILLCTLAALVCCDVRFCPVLVFCSFLLCSVFVLHFLFCNLCRSALFGVSASLAFCSSMWFCNLGTLHLCCSALRPGCSVHVLLCTLSPCQLVHLSPVTSGQDTCESGQNSKVTRCKATRVQSSKGAEQSSKGAECLNCKTTKKLQNTKSAEPPKSAHCRAKHTTEHTLKNNNMQNKNDSTKLQNKKTA